MKNAKLAFYILLLINISVQAANTSNKNRAFYNAFTIYNDADYDINVGFPYIDGQNNMPTSAPCLFKKHTSIVYHSLLITYGIKIGVATCFNYDDYNLCTDYHFSITDDYYDFESISAVHIYSYNDIRVTCNDGTTTSCVTRFNSKYRN